MVSAPPLAGREDWYLERQLQHFRTGVRGGAPEDTYGRQMARAAAVLWDDREVRDVVAYAASLPAQRSEPSVAGDASRGAELYAACAACHGENGEGSAELAAPRLAGLADWYVAAQLTAFRSGLRGQHADDGHGQEMRAAALELPDGQALNDVALYLTTLEPR